MTDYYVAPDCSAQCKNGGNPKADGTQACECIQYTPLSNLRWSNNILSWNGGKMPFTVEYKQARYTMGRCISNSNSKKTLLGTTNEHQISVTHTSRCSKHIWVTDAVGNVIDIVLKKSKDIRRF